MNADRLLTLYDRVADAPDATDRLRRFVLDLAVRGKLVEQDSDDEPASELLKRIAKEKARLVKAGKIRRQKTFSPVEEPPFAVPRKWLWTRVREVTSDRGQKVPDTPFTYIDVTAIDKKNGLVVGPKVLRPGEAPSRARKVTRRGDVIYSCVRPYLLNVAIIEKDFDPAPIASTAFAILNGHDFVLPRYLWIVLRSPFMISCVEQNQRGQAYPAINDADFAILPFPLPPLAEQRRIVAKVDELMALLDRLEEARDSRESTRDRLTKASYARLSASDADDVSFRSHARFAIGALPALTARADQVKHLRQTILNLAVRGKLVPQDPEDEPTVELLKRIRRLKSERVKEGTMRAQKTIPPVHAEEQEFSLPSKWLWVRLGEVIKLWNGLAFKSSDFTREGIPVVRIGDLKASTVSVENAVRVSDSIADAVADEIWIPENALLLAMSGATTGKTAFNRTGQRLLLNQRVGRIEPLLTKVEFIRLFFETIIARNLSISLGSAIPNLSAKQINETAFPLPPLAEQHRIVAKVDELMAICDQLETNLGNADNSRQHLVESLIHETLAPAIEREMEAAE